MKKVASVIVIILAIVVAGIFMINGKKENTDVTKNQTKVGFLMIGSHDDKSYNQSHYEGMEQTAKKLNLHVLYKENVPVDETCKVLMEELIAEGCEIIICNSYDYGEWIAQTAKENPHIYFFHATGTNCDHNLATYFGRIYQMRYLSGIVAGLQTKTNEIGYVAAYPISEVNRGINAFTLGVRKVNPDAVVHVEWSQSWTEDAATEAATQKLFDNYKIDVIAMHTDSIRALEMAEEKGIWSIGYNVDNSKSFPKTFLTAPVWQWENYYEPYILKCLQGKFKGEHYWEGASTGVVGLADLTEKVKPQIVETVEQEKKRMEEGSFDVFYGPITDNEGNLRVGEGENLSDDAMLNAFDWYVEGVIVHE
ncbi:MAG: BMP family ABC transporter substrate-binding protein [Lachnospiraceae bacterium]|nr:BMP family ABC transporter substrate-binding protein [Lachnospiraceae bacterium]